MNKLILIAVALFISSAYASADEQDEQCGTPTGDPIDPSNPFSVDNALKGYQTFQDATNSIGQAQNIVNASSALANISKVDPTTAVGGAAASAAVEYKTAIQTKRDIIIGNLQKFQGYLEQAEKRVDRWNTTLPTLQSFTKSSTSFIEDFAHHLESFEISDLWDIDQIFFKTLEDKVALMKNFSWSIVSWLENRMNSEDYDWDMTSILENLNGATPFKADYSWAHIPPPPVKEFPNEDQTEIKALYVTMQAVKRIQMVDFAENGCDKEANADLNCSDPNNNSRRKLYIARITDALDADDLTSQDIDKVNAQIQKRRVEIAFQRKIIAESRNHAQIKLNDALDHFETIGGIGQKVTCRGYKLLAIDQNNLTDDDPNGCEDVASIDSSTRAIIPSSRYSGNYSDLTNTGVW